MFWVIAAMLVGVWLLSQLLNQLEIKPGLTELPNFEAISDEEFLRRCSPGTSKEVALKVRRIVSEQLGVPYEKIHPEHRFVEDLGAD